MEDAVDVNVVTRDPKLYFLQSNQAQNYLERLKEAEGDQDVQPLKLSQREIGKRMHEVLSKVSDASQLEEVLSQAQEEGTIGDGEEWKTITTRIKEGFQDSIVASWFKAENTVFNECGIAGKDEKSQPIVLRPDRVIINGNSITVIDYKFGRPNGDYITQVRNYMDFMHRMYPNHEIKGYLWYIMGKEAVEVKNDK